MTRDEIVKALHGQDITIGQLAAALKVTRSAVSNVIAAGKGSRRVATAIAKLLDRPLGEVFPHYAQPRPRRRTGRGLAVSAAAIAARLTGTGA